ncbi:efflux RND transporter periplasmic adaptor subunit [Bacteroidales bacterium OttesenSCG-928-B11]|nr:efflux RND transporter periplasmic adaptor subunit [Bacteroidales bacterium OttesenSCG-928-C03]MDL2311441.1 efflux RND transporter periplasmic adaptor subunit [Bacteroidales bacterium OttesenSCG-928-B11]
MKKIIKTSFLPILFFVAMGCNRNEMQYDASGTFETTEIIVAAEASGKIMMFDLAEGDVVEQGQIVGFIDSTQLYLSKLQLKNNIKAVKSRKTDVSTQLAAIEEQLVTLNKEKQRVEKLLRANAANTKQLDDINAQIAILERQLTAQRTMIESGNYTINEESSVLEIQIAQLDDQLKKCYISTPISGTVLVKYAEQGEVAVPGKALFKVADTEDMILRAYVSAAQFTQLKLGQEVSVFADFGEENTRKYIGAVSWISEKAEFTPKTVQARDERDNLVYAVKIRVKNDGYLKIGMYAGVKLTADNSSLPTDH